MTDRLERAITLLEDLVACPTVSADSNLAMIDILAARLAACGARVDLFRDETGAKANLFASLGPDIAGGVVLSGHTDVVPVADQVWTTDPFALRRADGRLYGRGTCDMKGFIAAAVVLAEDMAQARLRRPLHLAFTHDEEVGCLGARALVQDLQRLEHRPAMAIVGEPTGMRVIEGHKGCCEYTVRFAGRAGHGARPDQGVNAAEFAVRYVQRLLDLRGALMLRAPQTSRFVPPWTTINIGRISAGVAHNVIASTAEVAWEMRPVQDSDLAFVKSRLAQLIDEELLPLMRAIAPEAGIETEVIGEVAGLEVMDDNAARDLVNRLMGTRGADVVAFGTEAGLFQQLGMSVVVCGPGFIDQAHRPDEFLAIDQLAACQRMLARLGQSLTEPNPRS